MLVGWKIRQGLFGFNGNMFLLKMRLDLHYLQFQDNRFLEAGNMNDLAILLVTFLGWWKRDPDLQLRDHGRSWVPWITWEKDDFHGWKLMEPW